MKRTLLSAVLVLSILSPAMAANLNNDQLRAEFSGKSFKFLTAKGAAGRIRYSKNGKVHLSKTNFDVKSDTGTWRIKGNRICSRWKIIRGGKEKCFGMRKTGKGNFMDTTGTKVFR